LDDPREFMMGIDEAGRGPTLGPMVYGAAFCAVEDEHRLRAMGFNDSKQLTEAKRAQLWDELQTKGFLGWRIRVLEAKEISAGMLRKHTKYNLNAMSHDAAIGLVQGVLATGVNLRYLYVDTVGDPERYQAKLPPLPGAAPSPTSSSSSSSAAGLPPQLDIHGIPVGGVCMWSHEECAALAPAIASALTSAPVPMPSLPTGGVANASMAAAATQALSKLAAALVARAAAGTQVDIQAPAAATIPATGSYCGALSAASFVSLRPGTAAAVSVNPPLAPCIAPGGAAPAGLPLPAPSVSLPPSVASALAALHPGLAVSLSVVQNGFSPVSETAGLSKLVYKALPAKSDLAIREQVRAAKAAAVAAAAAAGGSSGSGQIPAGTGSSPGRRGGGLQAR
jgi:ribonuclease HII